jgi:hypothetical protein
MGAGIAWGLKKDGVIKHGANNYAHPLVVGILWRLMGYVLFLPHQIQAWSETWDIYLAILDLLGLWGV